MLSGAGFGIGESLTGFLWNARCANGLDRPEESLTNLAAAVNLSC